ncbi:serine/threonine kinase [Methanosarcina sp. MTP4]|uniref:formylglycine-generating enzyme family protein n=1 Tax=Methanosarcina sp. MTP4 TaxID=1434100 RepID=UPI000615F9D9|nr:formylglycine-generating enzyme family protein [Methanosarcina sp. MTP4]AKB26593.1 serine/threonine kinase [Methanosarcina sp. MTP4]
MPSHPIAITRTIYDPALKDFVFDSPEGRAMPNIRQWIDKQNPVIYWYILRVDNPSELLLDQWAVELYNHQALNITDAYIDGIDRRFELKKRERDPWSDKYVLSIPKQLGIPIVGSGTRRIFFKVDVNCREGLMHEYGISGKFIAQGVEAIDVREKMFRYSCKVGEFRQIFDNNPDEASIYAERRLSFRYSSKSVQVFTNSFRMIHDLYKYCHSGPIGKDDLLYKLNSLYSNFEKVPEIADKRINPLLNEGIKVLTILDEGNMSEFKSRYLRLCDSLVEQLHIEVLGANLKDNKVSPPPVTPSPSPENQKTGSMKEDSKAENGKRECPLCMNLIDSSNRSLLCGKCGAQFCQICESWFREKRKRGEKPLCENCFTAEKEILRKQMEEKRKLSNSIGMKFVKIPVGDFMMGSKEYNDEQPVRKVTIKTSFLLSKYPVTQKQWKAVMGNNPSHFRCDNNPVEMVSWEDAQEFIKKLNQMEGANEYRLPSEAEWEYACRAGTATKYYFGDDESKLGDYAWYSGNSGGKTHPVGEKNGNPWGIHDMHGNVWEWVQDKYHGNYEGAPSDESAWEGGSSSNRFKRGGSWFSVAGYCRSAYRSYLAPGSRLDYLGFRLLRKL